MPISIKLLQTQSRYIKMKNNCIKKWKSNASAVHANICEVNCVKKGVDSIQSLWQQFVVFNAALYNTHRSATTLKPLTGEVHNIDHLVTMPPVKGVGNVRQQVNSRFLKLMCGSRKNGEA